MFYGRIMASWLKEGLRVESCGPHGTSWSNKWFPGEIKSVTMSGRRSFVRVRHDGGYEHNVALDNVTKQIRSVQEPEPSSKKQPSLKAKVEPPKHQETTPPKAKKAKLVPSFGYARKALIVGMSHYPGKNKLRNPVNDASDMAAALRKSGFDEVELCIDGPHDKKSMAQIMALVNKFQDSLNANDAALFFFAGHGSEYMGHNYLMPSGESITDERELSYKAVSAQKVLQAMESKGAGFNVLILDCCRVYEGMARAPVRTRAVSDGLCEMQVPHGSVIAFACSPGTVAFDGAGRNGTFTEHLVKHIERHTGMQKDIRLLLNDAYLDVSESAASSGVTQVPWMSATALRVSPACIC